MIPTHAIRKMNAFGAAQQPFCFILDFEGEEAVVCPPEELAEKGIQLHINGFSHDDVAGHNGAAPPLHIEPVPFSEYLRAFNIVQSHLQAGNSYLVNLTFSTRIETAFSLEDIYRVSRAPYKLLWPGRFVVFSPEQFVRIRSGVISTYPMKGTIDADLPDAIESILADVKEHAEHVTIVDLLRNDLNRVAKQVRVTRFRYIDRIYTNKKDLLQVSSEITGVLPPDFCGRLGDIFAELLPAGSISGAPKYKTLEIIREAEGAPRGFYTGVFGYFNGRSLESAVMIRFIEQQPGGTFFRSGGGITILSNPEQEYRELIDKVYLPVQ